MAKHALSFLIKIVLFAAIMLIVAKIIPYDDLVDFIAGRFDFQSANELTALIWGEPDTEAWESLHGYVSILINTLISIPLLSIIITAYNTITHKVKPSALPQEWAFSTLRRFAKIFAFTLLFCVLFRLLPYQSIFSERKTYSTFSMVAVVAFNLLITVTCYWFITKKITIKRSL
ncbi:hypothetical protein PMPD1_1867 [Paramixta manurensis]|uniref:DUF2975 domain-containing protein n=1 Tax=Paramixta manurensis TaxID=2740817 RepID=A0A6M8UEA5_9GAMM|nr:hypothetical protein PMPD1_1867 [Erwiniaceae bacterium PD-1]